MSGLPVLSDLAKDIALIDVLHTRIVHMHLIILDTNQFLIVQLRWPDLKLLAVLAPLDAQQTSITHDLLLAVQLTPQVLVHRVVDQLLLIRAEQLWLNLSMHGLAWVGKLLVISNEHILKIGHSVVSKNGVLFEHARLSALSTLLGNTIDITQTLASIWLHALVQFKSAIHRQFVLQFYLLHRRC